MSVTKLTTNRDNWTGEDIAYEIHNAGTSEEKIVIPSYDMTIVLTKEVIEPDPKPYLTIHYKTWKVLGYDDYELTTHKMGEKEWYCKSYVSRTAPTPAEAIVRIICNEV